MENNLLDQKIEDAQKILDLLLIPEQFVNKYTSLTLLGLCKLQPTSNWSEAQKTSFTLNKGLMAFINANYSSNYKDGTREAFRKALNTLVDFNMANLNPDDPSLPANSSKTHYALTSNIIELIKKYQSEDFEYAYSKYLHKSSEKSAPIIKHIRISNFKSIDNLDLELGRINVLIGANGSGKSNILEAIAMAGAAKSDDLDIEGIISRGIRAAKPSLTMSSFFDQQSKKEIEIDFSLEYNGKYQEIGTKLLNHGSQVHFSKWYDASKEEQIPKRVLEMISRIFKEKPQINEEELLKSLNTKLIETNPINISENAFMKVLKSFLIYGLNTPALRGLTRNNFKVPLGINGEGIDVLINSFDTKERYQLSKCTDFFSWLKSFEFEKNNELKQKGYKLGKSISKMYFKDKYMQKQNNLFSAENANEGILHVIFYLALFISKYTPNFFAIDNIETALNPKLCRRLVKELNQLAIDNDKQCLITTHNPAVLDGLNLLDDEQRLFTVSRDRNGKTKVKRIKFKSDLSDKEYKLSEMWMKGLMGALPNEF